MEAVRGVNVQVLERSHSTDLRRNADEVTPVEFEPLDIDEPPNGGRQSDDLSPFSTT
jgi:hypothetical protein